MRLDDKEFLEEKYKEEDPWGYQTNPDDINRKEKILAAANKYGPFKQAIDIGCGEGWITTGLPADYIYGYEISDRAASRFPGNIDRYMDGDEVPVCDLVVATGVFYEHYDYNKMMEVMEQAAGEGGIIITCHIEDAEVPMPWMCFYLLEAEQFDYRGKKEILRVYKV